VYNAVLKKTVSMVAGDTYTAYANGTDSLSGPSAKPKFAACGVFADVDSKGEWCPYVTKLLSKGVIRSNASFSPDNRITRAELLKMVVLASGQSPKFDAAYSYGDVKSSDWFASYVSTAKKLGYVSAANANFEPNRSITRAEAMKILMNFRKATIQYNASYSYGDVKSSDWFASYVSTAKRFGYISATNSSFRPNDSISRAEVSKILNKAFFP
jgi:N-acetylmuramoyl-L-alanine amidase